MILAHHGLHTAGLAVILGYLSIGFVTGLVVAVREERDRARGGHHDGDSPGATILVMTVVWPLFAFALLVVGAGGVAVWLTRRLARVERLPEVRERRIREAEDEVGIR